MPPDLEPGATFPQIELPDSTGERRRLHEIASGMPAVVCFVRGWWCPKEQVRLRGLTEMQEELQREYGGVVAITVDPPYVNGAFRAGLGASFPFLSDPGRSVAEELELLELTDETHRPYLPMTFVLDSRRRIEAVWCGFWYWGNPTPAELRLALRSITCREQPTMNPQAVWAGGGAASPQAGIDADVVLVNEGLARPGALARCLPGRHPRGRRGAFAIAGRRPSVGGGLDRAHRR